MRVDDILVLGPLSMPPHLSFSENKVKIGRCGDAAMQARPVIPHLVEVWTGLLLALTP